jgi:molybdenum cofactor cytidylyltransferase
VIAAVLLAAGSARRFGAPKLVQDLEGRAVVRWSAEALRRAMVDEIVVVVPPGHEGIRQALAGLNVRFVVNPTPDSGMGASLARGISALSDDTNAALIALADEPAPDPRALPRVVERWRAGDATIVVPTYRGVRGHPVLFDRSVFGELATLTGDQGARLVVDRDPSRVAYYELDAGKPVDIDTPADFERAREGVQLDRTLIDRVMPLYHEKASYWSVVQAPTDVVYRAVLGTDLARSLLARGLMALRSLGTQRMAAFRFGALPVRGTFFKLSEEPGREIVAGVLGSFWRLRGNISDGDAESFRAPLAPGTAKAAWSFRVEASRDDSKLTTETRVLCGDEESRRQFHRYWTLIGPFSGLIRLEALRLIRHHAQYMSVSNPSAP